MADACCTRDKHALNANLFSHRIFQNYLLSLILDVIGSASNSIKQALDIMLKYLTRNINAWIYNLHGNLNMKGSDFEVVDGYN